MITRPMSLNRELNYPYISIRPDTPGYLICGYVVEVLSHGRPLYLLSLWMRVGMATVDGEAMELCWPSLFVDIQVSS
jgi:hypothetical protein